MNDSHMKKSILKRTVFGVFLVLLLAMMFTAPVIAEEEYSDEEYDDAYWEEYFASIKCSCNDGCQYCEVYCGETPENPTGACLCPEPVNGSAPKTATPMIFYVNMPDGYDGRVLTISLDNLPLPPEKKAIAAIEMDITKPMNEGEVAEVIARIPKFMFDGLDIDPSHFALYHLVDGEWVKMDVTISYATDGDLLIETTSSSFGVFVVVIETA